MDYSGLDKLIDHLESIVEDSDPKKGYWKELWGLVRQIGSEFKNSRFPTAAARQRAWDRFQELVAKAKARSEEQKSRVRNAQREWGRREERSSRAKQDVEAKARGARPMSSLEHSIADLVLFPLTLIRKIIEELVGCDDLSKLDEVRNDLLNCNEKLREAWGAFNEHKADLLPGDKNQALQALKEAQEKLEEAWRRWKEQKGIVRERRRRAWEERQQERAARQAEKERKHEIFLDRVRENIRKLEWKLEKAKSALERQEAHLADLRDKYDTAWNDSYKDRCSTWIDECQAKIADISAHIERLEGWIEQEKKKLD